MLNKRCVSVSLPSIRELLEMQSWNLLTRSVSNWNSYWERISREVSINGGMLRLSEASINQKHNDQS